MHFKWGDSMKILYFLGRMLFCRMLQRFSLFARELKSGDEINMLEENLVTCFNWSTRPTTAPAGSDHYFHTLCPSARSKTSKSSDNHYRPGLWAGRVDHWWLLSCNFYLLLNISIIYHEHSELKMTHQGPFKSWDCFPNVRTYGQCV